MKNIKPHWITLSYSDKKVEYHLRGAKGLQSASKEMAKAIEEIDPFTNMHHDVISNAS